MIIAQRRLLERLSGGGSESARAIRAALHDLDRLGAETAEPPPCPDCAGTGLFGALAGCGTPCETCKKRNREAIEASKGARP